MGEAKRKKQRDCPAKGGEITPEECGRGRNSSIACPVTCPHNPFAAANHAEHFEALEAKVFGLLGRKLIAELTPSQVREMADAMNQGDDFTTQALLTWHLIGEGRLAKWLAEGFARDWKNDEAVMLGHFQTLRPALLEFRGVVDELTCNAVDLLDPESPTFAVIDPGVASRVDRYEILLGWVYALPTGQRLSGGAVTMPAMGTQDPAEAFAALLDHLGAPAEGRELWMLEHMILLGESFRAIESARRDPSAKYDLDLVPDAFRASVATLDDGAEVLADHPQPELGGKTPREAAADPVLRPRLVRLLKEFIRSGDRLRRTVGMDIDSNLLLGEIRLEELILPPPPLGFLDEDEADFDDAIPLDPLPPQEMLDSPELDDRLQAATGDEALWNRLEIRLADVLDAFNDLPDKLNANELETLQSTVLAALGALHPDQPPGYEPDTERMLARYEAWMRSGDDQEDLADYAQRIFEETRQPALCEAAADMMFFLEKQSGKKLRPKKLDVLMTALAAAIWEAAHWPPVLKS
ncbi:hypothetical protein [Luteolibacter soli]|uniref:Uncharacterized protein n=1 Tax=Luteolibacter soli TaxID=3135280 RepID=A0ABU9AYU4_9BACT